MPSTFGQFTEESIVNTNGSDFLVGYNDTGLGGERRYTLQTISQAVSSIIEPAISYKILGLDSSFVKSDSTIVSWTKTADFAVSTQTTFVVLVGNSLLTISSGTVVSMPSPTVGTDYAIWATPSATLQATNNHTTPPVTNARKVGGFHYAPGSNATAQAGGNTTPQINSYSFWDLNFRPNCPDPRGMALVADSFWADIYLCGVDHITNGTSKYNVSIADGSAPPKIPTIFGGNGTTAYANGQWFNFMEVLTSYRKRPISYHEFIALAYGTTENTSSGGTDVQTTGVTGTGATSQWNVFTSKWGVIQSTGCVWTWGSDTFGNFGTSWTTTGDRGEQFGGAGAARFGGNWNASSNSGSRCSNWNDSPTSSSDNNGVRGACDHLILV
jgi:hypothetical protein